MHKLFPRILLAVVLTTGLAACDNEGPMERAGEQIDEAGTDIGNAVEDACEDAKDSVDAKDADC